MNPKTGMLSSHFHIQNPLHRSVLRLISERVARLSHRGTNMPTMDDCRRKAEQCLRWADEAANDQQREHCLR